MNEPKIMYCRNNHVYDAGIYSMCPYCQKIAENQKKLGGSYETRGFDPEAKGYSDFSEDETENWEEEEETELLRDAEEKTELLSDGEDEDATELLRPENRGESVDSNLAGWLVALNGNQRGSSREVKYPCQYRQYEIVLINGVKYRFLKLPDDFWRL